MLKKAIIYLRVSTEEQAEKGFSLQAQRDECLKKAKELGCIEIMEYCDEGVSGSLLERPMLLNSLEEMKERSIDYFICFDPSRLSRNVSHQLILIDNIKKSGVKLIFAQSSYEDTAEGRFQLTIMAAVDEYERARLKIRTELGKRTKANQKLLTHNPNIYGYRFDKESDTLSIYEEQAGIVRQIFDWMLYEGMGPASIADRLNEIGIPSMRGKQWSRVSTNRVLNNYSYTGTLYIRRYDTRDYSLNKYKKKNEKSHIIEKPKDQWIAIEIPSIIDEDTWQKTKKILNKSKRLFKNRSKYEYLLTGILRCGDCGGTMYGKTSSGKTYYCCINKYNYKLEAVRRCNSRLLNAEKLEKQVWNKVKACFLNKKEVEKALDNLLYNKEELQKESQKKDESMHQLILERKNIITLFQRSYINEEELKTRLKVIEDKIKYLNNMYKTVLPLGNIDIGKTISLIDEHLSSITVQDKNKILHKLINEIKVNGTQITLLMNISSSFLKEM